MYSFASKKVDTNTRATELDEKFSSSRHIAGGIYRP
jgi:hypothetical protein